MTFFTNLDLAEGSHSQLTTDDELVGQEYEDLPGEHNLVDTNGLLNGDILFDNIVHNAMNIHLNGLEDEEMLEFGTAQPPGVLMDEDLDIEDLIVMHPSNAINFAAYVVPMPPTYPQNNEHGNNVVVHVVPVNIEVDPVPLQQQDEDNQPNAD